MKVTAAAVLGLAAGAWAAMYTRRYFGALVTWAFARGDTPRRQR
ncbi:hypothetical protein [Microbacterium jejuense]|nr:hypothetical protein [Microbacterium jejuense]